MERGSDKHGPVQDEQLKKELRGMEQADHSTRAEEWRDPEPPADDDPALQDPREAEIPDPMIGDLMTPHVISVAATAPVAAAAEAMADNDVGDVLVMDDGRLTGLITDRDLATRVLAGRRDPAQTTVGDVCTTELVSVSPETPVSEAIDIMREQAVRRLAVIAADGSAQGVISIGDLAVSRDPDSALADISAAPPTI